MQFKALAITNSPSHFVPSNISMAFTVDYNSVALLTSKLHRPIIFISTSSGKKKKSTTFDEWFYLWIMKNTYAGGIQKHLNTKCFNTSIFIYFFLKYIPVAMS